jgi:hypothetical protein
MDEYKFPTFKQTLKISFKMWLPITILILFLALLFWQPNEPSFYFIFFEVMAYWTGLIVFMVLFTQIMTKFFPSIMKKFTAFSINQTMSQSPFKYGSLMSFGVVLIIFSFVLFLASYSITIKNVLAYLAMDFDYFWKPLILGIVLITYSIYAKKQMKEQIEKQKRAEKLEGNKT